MAERVKRLQEAIREAVKLAPAGMQEVIRGLQALRGIAEISAVTVVAELGQIARFESARQLMGYSLGDHLKTGHLWSLQNRPLWMV
jgi:transposase